MTEPEPSPTASATPEKDLVTQFKGMPAAEKILAVAAVAALLGFILVGNWDYLFKHVWFPTCTFLGAVGVIVLMAGELFGVRLLVARSRTYVLVLLAVLPMFGFIIDQLRHPERAIMLAGAIAMALAGVKITARENILKS